MPLSKLQFRPGVNRESTTYANEGGFYACDKIRFRSGYAEKLGGWANQAPSYTYNGVARALINWTTYAGSDLLGVGTSQKYYVQNGPGGEYHDITPLRKTTNPIASAIPFATTINSKRVVVTDVSHGATAGSFVTFSSATSPVGGVTVNGQFEIVEVIGVNSYTIASPIVATSTATGGGAAVVAAYQINAGGISYTSTVEGGWGSGGWGVGPWGGTTSEVTTSIDVKFRVWSHTTHGEDLIMAVIGGPIYNWDIDIPAYGRAQLLSDHVTEMVAGVTKYVKIFKEPTSANDTGNTIDVVDSSGVDVGARVQEVTGVDAVYGDGTGLNAALEYFVIAINGNTITLSHNRDAQASGTYSFSYSGSAAPVKTNFIYSSDVYRFTIAIGANPYDPYNPSGTVFDPMLVRWSDQDNAYEWVPSITTQAGEQRLTNGSTLITAQNTRQEILVWSDAALYSMQYLGPPYVFGFTMLSDNISIASPYAQITASNITYWMGLDKFYMYTGRVETLPCTLRQFVFGNLNRKQMDQIAAGGNEAYNEVWWFYPSASSEVNDSYVIYNYLERIWYYGSLNRTAWLDSALRDYPMAAFSVQNNFLSADVTDSDRTLPVFNAVSYPATGTVLVGTEEITYTGVTSTSLTGCVRGINQTAGTAHEAYTPVIVKTPNQVMWHEFGVDDATETVPRAIASHIASADFDIGDGHNFGFVWRIIPDLTFSGSTGSNPSVFLTVKARQNSGSFYPPEPSNLVYRTSTYEVEQYTGQVYTRVRGRQMQYRVDSTALGTAWQLGAMRLDIRPDGRR